MAVAAPIFCRSVVVSPDDPHHCHRDRHEPPYFLQEARLEVLAAPLNPPRGTLTELSELFRLKLGLTAAIASREVRLERGDQRVDLLRRRVGGIWSELFLVPKSLGREARAKRVLALGLGLTNGVGAEQQPIGGRESGGGYVEIAATQPHRQPLTTRPHHFHDRTVAQSSASSASRRRAAMAARRSCSA
jgi:hypothetical protein